MEIAFKMNDQAVKGEEGQTLLQVAEKYGIPIPTLCHFKGLEPAGMCRLCTVEVRDPQGLVRFVTACNSIVSEGIEVRTETEGVMAIRRMLIELLLARSSNVPIIQELANQHGIQEPRFKKEENGCILCGLCIRICDKIGVNAITLVGRGLDLKVDTPYHIRSDLCIGCGSCANLCPTAYIQKIDLGYARTISMGDQFIREFELEKCLRCKRPFATKPHLDYLKEHVDLPMEIQVDRHFCPECSRKARAESMAGEVFWYG